MDYLKSSLEKKNQITAGVVPNCEKAIVGQRLAVKVFATQMPSQFWRNYPVLHCNIW